MSEILKRVAVFVGFQEDEAASGSLDLGWSHSGPGLAEGRVALRSYKGENW